MKLQLDPPRPPRAARLLPALAAFVCGAALPASAGTVVVQQVAQTFVPADIVINEGDTVEWHWSFGMHTVTEGTDGAVNGNEAFHSPLDAGTQVVSVTFDAAFLAANPRPGNRYDYFCAPHFVLGMVGSVTVCDAPTVYCTAKATSLPGCTPTISFSGTPSLALGQGFDVQAGPTPGGNPGLFIYTTNGPAATPIQNAFGFLCINPGPGLFRVGLQISQGQPTQCNGGYVIDFVGYAVGQTQDPNLIAGASVDIQAWYRDPPNPGTANLTNAGSFVLCP